MRIKLHREPSAVLERNKNLGRHLRCARTDNCTRREVGASVLGHSCQTPFRRTKYGTDAERHGRYLRVIDARRTKRIARQETRRTPAETAEYRKNPFTENIISIRKPYVRFSPFAACRFISPAVLRNRVTFTFRTI